MLISRNKLDKDKDRPIFNMWFGNFFEPYFSDEELTKQAMKDIAEMGFNTVSLDSKLSDDFIDYFEGRETSQYLKMQKLVGDLCAEEGLGLTYLALFNGGDNLYRVDTGLPTIRDSKPTFINPPMGPNGKLTRGYRHWSHEQMMAKIDHCMNLYKHIGPNCPSVAVDENGNKKKPFYFYHSPAFFQSYDKDGETRYINYLKDLYGTVEKLNAEYNTEYTSFDEISLKDVWRNLKNMNELKDTSFLRMYRDSQLYKFEVMDKAMEALCTEAKRRDPEFYLSGCISQWKYLAINNIYITQRGVDIWKMGKHLDCPTFYTMPSDSYGEPNAYTVPAELAILRSATRSDHINGGLFVGRYLFSDIYTTYSIGEIIASCYGAGSKDLLFYGYSGLDDGGNFGKWSKEKKAATKRALDWFTEVRRISGERVKEKKAAILFPYASFTIVDGKVCEICKDATSNYTNDFVGWYKQLSDCQINADILNPDQAIADIENYEMIVLPSDPYYFCMQNPEMEKAIKKATEKGAKVFASADCGKHHIFDIEATEHADDSMTWYDDITEHSRKFYSFENAETVSKYIADGKTAMANKKIGEGEVYSFGFDYGTCYIEKRQKQVPKAYGREAQYPLTVLGIKPFEKFTGLEITDGIEVVNFENGTLYVNHTSYSYKLPKDKNYLHLEEDLTGNILIPHSATFVF